MNLEYLYDKMDDELNDSCEYLRHAIEIKAMTPDWAKQFQSMSKAETDHASYIYKMFNEYYNKLSSAYKTMPDYMADIKKNADEMYMKKIPKIAALQSAYDKL